MRNPALIWLIPLLLGLVACSGKTVVESDLGLKGAPDWVNEGSQALNDKGGRLIHGMGQAPSMDDPSLQISVADNRARAEVARILSSYVDLAASDYSSAAASTGSEAISQMAVSQQLQSATQVNLAGARIIAHWKDKKSGTVYSLAELDMKQVKASLAAAQGMNAGVKRYLDSNADNLFDRLSKEKKI